MIESDFGRTQGAQVGRRRNEARPLTKADDGYVCEPLAALALVDAESFEAVPDSFRQPCSPPLLVIENDHADAPSFPIAARIEQERTGVGRGLAQCCRDRLDVGGRAAPEEGQGDVEVPSGDDPNARTLGQPFALPRNEPVERLVGEAQTHEEAKAVTPADASRARHAGS
jgi:hypothetical protein